MPVHYQVSILSAVSLQNLLRRIVLGEKGCGIKKIFLEIKLMCSKKKAKRLGEDSGIKKSFLFVSILKKKSFYEMIVRGSGYCASTMSTSTRNYVSQPPLGSFETASLSHV